MKTVDVTIAGVTYAMPVSFSAVLQIAESGLELFKVAAVMSSGQMLTLVQVVDVISAGVRQAGCTMSREEIGQSIVETGAQDYLKVASAYVIALVAGAPAVPVTSKKKK